MKFTEKQDPAFRGPESIVLYKQTTGGCGFHFKNQRIVVGKIIALPKKVLGKHIPGPHPEPEGFVDAPADGYPEIDRKYFRKEKRRI